MRAILKDTPNGMTVFFTVFLLTGVLIAIFLGDKIEDQANPYTGVAMVQQAAS